MWDEVNYSLEDVLEGVFYTHVGDGERPHPVKAGDLARGEWGEGCVSGVHGWRQAAAKTVAVMAVAAAITTATVTVASAATAEAARAEKTTTSVRARGKIILIAAATASLKVRTK